MCGTKQAMCWLEHWHCFQQEQDWTLVLSQLEVTPDCHTESVQPPCHQPVLAGTGGKRESWKMLGWRESPCMQGVSGCFFGSQSLGLRAAVGGISFRTWTTNPLCTALPRRNATVS